MNLTPADLLLMDSLFQKGSTLASATHMGVQQSTVSRRLSSLEERLGRDLFVRAPRGLIPTPVAERLRPLVARAMSALSTANSVLAAEPGSPSGLVRIALPEAFAHYIVAPRLRQFHDAYPHIELALDDGPELLDLSRAEAHLAIRVKRPSAGDVVSKRYMSYESGLFGAPDYLAGRALEDLTLLCWDSSHHHLPEARMLESIPFEGRRIRFRRMSTMLETARQGCGVVLTERRLAAEIGLVETQKGQIPKTQAALWIAAPRAVRHSPTVAAVWSWLEAVLVSEPTGGP